MGVADIKLPDPVKTLPISMQICKLSYVNSLGYLFICECMNAYGGQKIICGNQFHPSWGKYKFQACPQMTPYTTEPISLAHR